jgi:hypothetical protein
MKPIRRYYDWLTFVFLDIIIRIILNKKMKWRKKLTNIDTVLEMYECFRAKKLKFLTNKNLLKTL